MPDINEQKRGACWKQIVAGTALFFAAGCAIVVSALPREWVNTQLLHPVAGFMAAYLVAVAGFGIGYMKGFPRWSYPYTAYAFLFTIFWMGVSTPGFTLLGHTFRHDELWGWRAWIPLAVVSVVAVIATRSLRPVTMFFKNIGKDWTTLSFAMFGLMPLVVEFTFDEVQNSYEFPFALIAAILLVCGAVAFTRSGHTTSRVLSLSVSTGVTMTVAAVAMGYYWHGRQEAWMVSPANGFREALGIAEMAVVFLAGMCLPALMQLRRKRIATSGVSL